MPFLKTERIEFYYEIQGEGENLLFISGTGGDLRLSPNAFDNDLKDNFKLLAYDQRGLGQSQKPNGPYTMKDYADDAFSLLNTLGHKETYVIGVSFGGMVAQHFAIHYPEIVKKLVLVCTSPGGKEYHSYPLHELEEIPDDLEYTKKFISVSDLRINDQFIKDNPETYNTIVDQIKNYLRGSVSKENIGKLLQLDARKYHDVCEELERINCPTFIAGGLYDGIAPQNNINILNKLISKSEKKFYEGGHGFFMEDAQAWKDIISFLKN